MVGEGINFEGGRGYQLGGWERVSILRVGEGINFEGGRGYQFWNITGIFDS